MVGRPQPTSDNSVDLTRRYLAELGSYPLLTAEDEATLAQAIAEGRTAESKLADPGASWSRRERTKLQAAVRGAAEARRRFIQSNLRLVVSIAKRYQTPSMSLLDLIQEGNLGLMRAVEKFDHRKGFKFSTYATWWIRQAIGRGIADKGRTIRLPSHLMDTLATLSRSSSSLLKALGREPTPAELSEDTGIPIDKVQSALRAAPDLVSLSAAVGDDGDHELGDMLADPTSEAPVRRGRGRHRTRRPPLPARPARRAGAGDPLVALRARRRPAADARRGRPALQPHPRAHPSDRGQGPDQAAPPVFGAAPAPGRRALALTRRTTDAPGAARRRPRRRPVSSPADRRPRPPPAGAPPRRPCGSRTWWRPDRPSPATDAPSPSALDASAMSAETASCCSAGSSPAANQRTSRISGECGAADAGSTPAPGRARNTTSIRCGRLSTTTAGAPSSSTSRPTSSPTSRRAQTATSSRRLINPPGRPHPSR